MERTVSTLTLNVALAICGSNCLTVKKFAEEADANEYMLFTHFNYFYSYPEYGKKWKSGKDAEFHRVNTKCHLCGDFPERNYAGVGHIYLLNNGLSNDEILVAKNKKIVRGKQFFETNLIKNTPVLSQMICLCQHHVNGYFKWNPQMKVRGKQLSLF